MATLAQREAEVTLGSLCGIPDGKRRPVFLSLFAAYPWKPPLHPSPLGISDLSRVSADRWLLLWILTWLSKPATWVPVVFLPRSFSLLLTMSRCSLCKDFFCRPSQTHFPGGHTSLLFGLFQLTVAGMTVSVVADSFLGWSLFRFNS